MRFVKLRIHIDNVTGITKQNKVKMNLKIKNLTEGFNKHIRSKMTNDKILYSRFNCSSRICRKYRSEEHTSELQSRFDLVCRLLLEKTKPPDTSSMQPSPDDAAIDQ